MTSLDFALEVWRKTPESPNSHRRWVEGIRVPLEKVTLRLEVVLEFAFSRVTGEALLRISGRGSRVAPS